MSDAAARSYYGRPVVKEPVWTPEIPLYLFTGGLAGASAGLAALAGDGPLGRRAWATALAGAVASPALLISDLGVPRRFLNMLRMFKVTSPMSVGSWLLVGFGTATGLATVDAWTGAWPRVGRVARPLAGVLGLPLSTYTGALLAQTSVPVWHEARRELPFLFAAGAAASAGAVATVLAGPGDGGPAGRLTVVGAAAELVAANVMERRLGALGAPYHEGAAGRLSRAAKALTAGGAAAVAGSPAGGRPAALAGALAVLAGAVCERFSVFRAGFQSARAPEATIAPQRRRADEHAGRLVDVMSIPS